jgi:glycosyltransferase involved in cell wall biosynthesis
MNNSPAFTVIMTTYNAEKFLPRAIECVLNQTCQDFEIIVANDGSPDRSVEIARDYMRCSDKISLLDLPHSGGPAAPTNAALRISKGSFITFLEYDDEWNRDRLEKMLALFQEYPETGYAGSQVKVVNDNTQEITYYHFQPSDLEDEVRKLKIVTGGSFYNWSNIVIARKAFEDIGFLDEKLLIATEYDYFLRMGMHYKFRYVNEVLMTYHIHGNNVSIGSPVKNGKMLRDQEYLLEKYRQLYTGYPQIYARRLKDAAEWNIVAGSMKRALSLFVLSIRTYPFDPKTYIKFALSLLGRTFYRKIRKM